MRTYVLTFVGLLVLTGATVGLSFAPLGSWHVPAAIAIAFAKATLVALFFMHLAERAARNWVVAIVAVLMVGLLIGLPALDVATRVPPPIAHGLVSAPS